MKPKHAGARFAAFIGKKYDFCITNNYLQCLIVCSVSLTSYLVNGSYVHFELVRLNLLSQAPRLDHRHVPHLPVRSLPSLHPNIRARKFCGSIDLDCFSLLCSFDSCMPCTLLTNNAYLKGIFSVNYICNSVECLCGMLLFSQGNFNLKRMRLMAV